MIKKLTLLLLLIFAASCSSHQPVVRTTKPDPRKSGTAVTQANRQGSSNSHVQSKNGVVSGNEKQTLNEGNSTEVLEATTRVKVTNQMILDYIEKYKGIAKENMLKKGIPSSITLGQALLESGAGTGPLSVQANNHFGIKCHKEWTGPSIKHNDDAENECFRKYEKPQESFADHSNFLSSRPRYALLFALGKDDYKGWAKGLKMAGYATDPKYPEKLIGLIERYQLQRYDAEVLGKEYKPAIIKNDIAYENETAVHTVIKGDTLYSISKRYNITIEQLKKKNNLMDNNLSVGQTVIVR
ncbi:MAG: glucosaminidase domain-containing protein [Flavobacterium sp.]